MKMRVIWEKRREGWKKGRGKQTLVPNKGKDRSSGLKDDRDRSEPASVCIGRSKNTSVGRTFGVRLELDMALGSKLISAAGACEYTPVCMLIYGGMPISFI